MTPAVSIVVPVYNLEFYLPRSLDSVLAQGFHDFEVLAVDDGSTDDSPELLASYLGRDSRFRVLSKANGGHGSACNLGIAHARGEYVLFLDGDDWLGPEVVGEMVATARTTGADLLLGNLRYHLDDHTEVFRPLPVAQAGSLAAEEWPALFRNWPTPCGRLYRRQLFLDDPGLRFLEGVIHADASFAPKTYLAARSIHYVNRVWYEYDLTRPEQSMKVSSPRVLDIVPALRDALAFYRTHDAFERCRAQLEYYTLMHVLTWVPRVGRLPQDQVQRGLGSLFSLLDEWFPGWLDGAAFAALRPSPVSRMVMRVHHATGFRSLMAKRAMKAGLLDAFLATDRLARRPQGQLRRLRTLLESLVGSLDEPF